MKKNVLIFVPSFSFDEALGIVHGDGSRYVARDEIGRYIGIKRLISTEQRTGGSPNTTGSLSDNELNRGGFPKYS